MPKAGIQRDALDELEVGGVRVEAAPTAPASRANDASETAERAPADQAVARAVACWARASSASAPASGRKTTRLSMRVRRESWVEDRHSSLHQVVAEDQHDAEERATPRRCGSSRSAACASAPPSRARATPVPLTMPSMIQTSTTFHSTWSETHFSGCTIVGVVELVDPVLVQQRPVHRRRSCARPSRPGARFEQEEEGGDADAERARAPTTRPSASARSARRRARRAAARMRRPRGGVRGRRPASPRARPAPPCAARSAHAAAAPGGSDGSRNASMRLLAAERVRHADVAGDDRAERQEDQRDGHRRRRVVQVRRHGHGRGRGRAPPCAPWPCASCHAAPRRARRGRSGTPGGTCRSPSAATSPRRSTQSTRVPGGEGLEEDLVLAEEAGQAPARRRSRARRSGTSSR